MRMDAHEKGRSWMATLRAAKISRYHFLKQRFCKKNREVIPK
jgi:hypothetical protein